MFNAYSREFFCMSLCSDWCHTCNLVYEAAAEKSIKEDISILNPRLITEVGQDRSNWRRLYGKAYPRK